MVLSKQRIPWNYTQDGTLDSGGEDSALTASLCERSVHTTVPGLKGITLEASGKK